MILVFNGAPKEQIREFLIGLSDDVLDHVAEVFSKMRDPQFLEIADFAQKWVYRRIT